VSEREREMSLLRCLFTGEREMKKYVEQPREWKIKRLEKKTHGTIRGATKGMGNEKVKRQKNQENEQVSQP